MSKSRQTGTLRRLLPFVGRFWPALILSLICAAGAVLLQLWVPILFGDAIDAIRGTGWVDFSAMGRALWQAALCAAGAALCTWGMNRLNNRITYGVVEEVRARAIRHIQKT